MEKKPETRKIQFTGKSTYIVSLPKWWVNELGLKAGDDVSIQVQEDSSLLILPKSLKPEKVEEVIVKLSPKENPYAIARKVVALYLVGYNVIRLVTEEGRIQPVQREVITQFVRTKLAGTEITTDLPNEIVIQVLMSYPELSVKGALRRMFLIAVSMGEDAISSLEKMDQELAKDVIARDDEVDRFGMYVIRLLKSAVGDPRMVKEIGLTTARDCLGYRLVTKSVERISDHMARIAKNVLCLRKPLDPQSLSKIRDMSDFAIKTLKGAMDSLFREDYELAERVIESGMEIEKYEEKVTRAILEKASKEDVIALRLVAESLRRVAEYSVDIAEIVLNLTVLKTVERKPLSTST